jgi:carbohydrate-selective porin OprB
MNISQTFVLFICLVLLNQPIIAKESTKEETNKAQKSHKTKNKKLALSVEEPELIYALLGNPKFYGDENMLKGNIFERSYLLGSLWNSRDKLAKKGIYLNLGITQFCASNVAGGKKHGKVRYDGTSDYWAILDSGKANLWGGGLIILHGESSWQANKSVNADVGSLLQPNSDATKPVSNKNTTTLSEASLTQALPYHLLLVIGKLDFSDFTDQSLFANNERNQFIYTGLVNNPIIGTFIPYTPLGVAIVWTPNKKHNLAGIVLDADGTVTKTGFDTVFNSNTTLEFQYQYSPLISNKLPGNYRLIIGYTSKKPKNFAIDKRQLIKEVTGTVPIAKKSDNYSVLVNFDQYLWIKKESLNTYQKKLDRSNYSGAGRHHFTVLGVGIFARAGWAPKDRNVIDQFYSFGFGGFGVFSRIYDQWGIGYAATHISSDLRKDLDLLKIHLHVFEHAFEAFYNFQITPAMHLTLNSQIIKSPLKSRDTAYTIGSRFQFDF